LSRRPTFTRPAMLKFHPDRLLSVGFIHPALRLLNRSRGGRVPILMYHGIRTETGPRRPYFETNTTPELFASQLRFLIENGFQTVSLAEALQDTEGRLSSQKRVVITFDDGYRDFYTTAFPILRRHGLTATVFVISGFTRKQPGQFNGKELMTWDEVRTVRSHGIEIGSHTVDHPKLWQLSPHDLEYQLRHSKATIEDALGEPVQSFSHPFAFPEQDTEYVERLSGLLDKYGYEHSVSTIIGTAGRRHARYHLPRLPVNSYDDSRLFRAKLEGAYDWLHLAQFFYKTRLKRQRSAVPRAGQKKAIAGNTGE